MTAYVLVIALAASGHHQPYAVGYPDQGACLVAAERLRRNKKFHVECLKFVQGRWCLLEHDPEKHALGLDPMGGCRFSEKIMLH
jgi:hypothetical protein